MFEHLSDHIEIVELQSPSPRRNVAFVHLGEDVHKDKLGDERSLAGTAAHEAGQFGSTSEVGQGSLSPLVIKPGKQLQEAWKAMWEVCVVSTMFSIGIYLYISVGFQANRKRTVSVLT